MVAFSSIQVASALSTHLSRLLQFSISVLFLLGLAIAVYKRPIPDDFDRYVYEAIVLGKSEPVESIYARVKHESPRAEGSSVLDSPQHLSELEPLYKIRPLYIDLISLLGRLIPIQRAINLLSALSLFGIGIVVLLWTQKPLQTALLMTFYPVLNLGRSGTPDALAALLAISALCLIDTRGAKYLALGVLFLSLGVRTDNILVLLAVLAWMLWDEKVSIYVAAICALLAIAIVLGINHWAGNYGWIVLFRYSFIGGKYPAELPHSLSIREYLSGFFLGLTGLPQLAIWILIGIWAWIRKPDALLLVTCLALVAHFVLFPSPEARYLVWGGIVAAAMLIRSFNEPPFWERA